MEDICNICSEIVEENTGIYCSHCQYLLCDSCRGESYKELPEVHPNVHIEDTCDLCFKIVDNDVVRCLRCNYLLCGLCEEKVTQDADFNHTVLIDNDINRSGICSHVQLNLYFYRIVIILFMVILTYYINKINSDHIFKENQVVDDGFDISIDYPELFGLRESSGLEEFKINTKTYQRYSNEYSNTCNMYYEDFHAFFSNEYVPGHLILQDITEYSPSEVKKY